MVSSCCHGTKQSAQRLNQVLSKQFGHFTNNVITRCVRLRMPVHNLTNTGRVGPTRASEPDYDQSSEHCTTPLEYYSSRSQDPLTTSIWWFALCGTWPWSAVCVWYLEWVAGAGKVEVEITEVVPDMKVCACIQSQIWRFVHVFSHRYEYCLYNFI
jgi:hypothetical protein